MEHDNMQVAISFLLMFVDKETGKYITISKTLYYLTKDWQW